MKMRELRHENLQIEDQHHQVLKMKQLVPSPGPPTGGTHANLGVKILQATASQLVFPATFNDIDTNVNRINC